MKPEPPTNRESFAYVWRSPWVRVFVYVVSVITAVWLLARFTQVAAFALQVGLIGFFLAYLLNPVVNALGHIRIGRGFAVLIIYISLGLVLAAGSVLMSQVVTEAGRLINLIPTGFSNLTKLLENAQTWVLGVLENLPGLGPTITEGLEGAEAARGQFDLRGEVEQRVVEFLQQFVSSISQFIENGLKGGPGFLVSSASAVISTTFQMFLISVASAYFLYDFPRFIKNFRRFVPTKWLPFAEEVSHNADLAVGGFLRGQILITTMLGIMIWIGLTLLGVPLATALAFLAAVFNLVPFLGPIVGTIPAVLLGLTISPLTAVLALLVFIVANQVEAHLLGPLILSKVVNVHPVTVLLSILAGAAVGGLPGALFAVPVVALSKVLIEEHILTLRLFDREETRGIGYTEKREQTGQEPETHAE